MKRDLLGDAKARLKSRTDLTLPRFTNVALIGTGSLALIGAFVPLEVSVSGSGELYGGTPPATLTAPFNGVVTDVLQEPRENYAAGEKLAVLKPSNGLEAKLELDAQLNLANAKQEEIVSALEAINALLLGRRPPAHLKAAGMQAAVAQVSALQVRAVAAGRMRAAAERRLALAMRARATAGVMIERKRELVLRGILPRNSAFDLDVEALELEQQVESAQSNLDQARSSHEDLHGQISGLLLQQRAQFVDESRVNQARISELKVLIFGASQLLAQSEIRAPVGGYVEALSPVFVGRPVTMGEPLYTVTPISLEHTLRVLVPNSAVAQINLGDPVRVRIEALNRSTIDYMKGEVVRVSEEPEPVPPAMLMLPGSARRPLEYTVEVKMKDVTPSKAVQLRSGMRAQANIIVSKRAALIYVLAPLIDRLKPFGEP